MFGHRNRLIFNFKLYFWRTIDLVRLQLGGHFSCITVVLRGIPRIFKLSFQGPNASIPCPTSSMPLTIVERGLVSFIDPRWKGWH